MKHPIKIVILIAILFLILYLTLQTPEQTWSLTNAVQSFLLRLFSDGTAPNWIADGKLLRRAAHIPEYFLLGQALCSVFKDGKHGLLTALTLGILIGLADETLKIFLSTREFSFIDFMLDTIGVTVVVALFIIFKHTFQITITNSGG